MLELIFFLTNEKILSVPKKLYLKEYDVLILISFVWVDKIIVNHY